MPVDDLFSAVDALLNRPKPEDDLPPPAERERLRKLADFTQDDVAKALKVRRETLVRWEAGSTEPRPPKREAYVRLLAVLALRHGTGEQSGWLTRAQTAGLAPTRAADTPPAAPTPATPAPTESAPVMLDQTPTGELVLAEPAPCVRCGKPSVYRAGGRPMHGGDWCSPPAPTPMSHDHASRRPDPAAPRQPAAAAGATAAGRRPAPTDGPRTPPKAATAARKPAGQGQARPQWQQQAATRFPAGPLAVVDIDASGTHLVAHLADGRLLDVELPAKGRTIAALTQWALSAGLGAARLHQYGRDGDPLIVLTDAAAAELGLPRPGKDRNDFDQRLGRLPATHKALKALDRAGWELTQRGFGPWARVFRRPEGGGRECVQYCIPQWGALTSAGWHVPQDLDADALARLLGTYATTVITPRGSTAVSGLELMTALRPPTKPVRTSEGGWVSGPVPGSLHHALDAAPPELPAVHPHAQGRGDGPDEVLMEEAWDWWRPLTDEEATLPYAVGLDVNTAFLAAANRLNLGLSEPVHELSPAFDKKTPGCWLVDLSGLQLDPRLPNPFTPDGTPPTGPAWYATPTIAYATELGARIQPLEGWLRHESGPYLDPWHDRLATAYKKAMARLGVPADLTDPHAFLEAMTHLKDGDQIDLAVLAAIKATAKGGIGKLREKPRGADYRPGQPWPALERPTWRPDIRAAVIATARVNMHRKLRKTAATTGRYPIAVLSDCAVYPADAPGALDVVPLDADGRQLSGTLRLGVAPGMVKHEGTRPMAQVAQYIADGLNPARHIKPGTDAVAEGE
ncbi:transcriptional regulator [Kitasatospora herbaricolor]|uniref:telomere-associated protein Tap n=1 Tax=Kitasatospora herbaricolor TaxID=68217 RepID=UPI00174DB6D2|nr:helix-turn-helix transcriptional regulator [Kitasatospora herbaricolor]MDQ0313320.1 DNA-binding transcriptional regulator YiaG/GNAT superfamily N-acetyltransferase [Kitasatospora herbaricolor]GGV42064.1 transcriptional regulator [Kitasatospora herbaricolor]